MTNKYVPKSGDYVVHSQLTLSEYQNFHDTAILAGFNSYDGRKASSRFKDLYPMSGIDHKILSGFGYDSHNYTGGNDVTKYFKERYKMEFTKEDLRNTMLVEYRDGSLRMVWDSRLLREDNSQGSLLKNFNPDLSHRGDLDMDIIAIHQHAGETPNDFVKGEVLWNRVEKPVPTKKSVTLELTDEQLEKIKSVLED